MGHGQAGGGGGSSVWEFSSYRDTQLVGRIKTSPYDDIHKTAVEVTSKNHYHLVLNESELARSVQVKIHYKP